MLTDSNNIRNQSGDRDPHDVNAALLQATSDGVIVIDAAGVVTLVNTAAERMLGCPAGEMLGRPVHDLIHTTGDPDCPACAVLRDGNAHRALTDTFRRADGRAFPVQYNVLPITEGTESARTVIAFRDMTRRVQQERELRRLFAIIEQAPAFISTADRDRNITYLNKTGRAWLGLAEDEQPSGWPLAPASRDLAQQADEDGLWQGERDSFLGARRSAQPDRSVFQTVVAHKGADDTVEFYSTMAIDITEQKRLERERLRLLAIIEETPAFVAQADADGRIIYYNRAARRMLGIGPHEDIRSIHIEDTHPAWAARLVVEEGLPTAARAGEWSGETALLSPDGREIPVIQLIVAHKDSQGAIEYYSTIAKDITERKRMEERLHYLATHDSLTGIMNRARFQQCLQRELERAEQAGTAGAVLYLDVDNFKDVNDSLGHHAGDEMLRRIARVVQSNLRAGDKLARLGGDEFAVLLPQTTVADAQDVGQRLLTLLGDEAICVDEGAIRVRASMGVAAYPEDAATVEDVLIHADLSMFAAKRNGGNRLSVYDAAQEGRLRAQSRLNWERLCREALQKDRFTLHWQPLLDLRTHDVSAYELLLRMQGADGGLIAPGEFLPVCERSDLIHAIDRWVLAQAIEFLADLPDNADESVRLHVNLSRKTFSDEGLVPFVRERLDGTRVDAARIVLELTETATVQDVRRATCFMSELRNMGFLFALDDFGVGFSTFGALRRLPVDYLKIDGSFIRDLRHDPVNQHLVKAMVEVAQGLGKQTVAEFVPDEPTLQLLGQYGVDFGQGFHIGRPEPVNCARLVAER